MEYGIKFTKSKGEYAYTSTAGRYGLKYRCDARKRLVSGWEVWDIKTKTKIGTAANMRGAADLADYTANNPT